MPPLANNPLRSASLPIVPLDTSTSGSAFSVKVLRAQALEANIPKAIHTVEIFKSQGKRVLVYVRDAKAARLVNRKIRSAGLSSVDFCNMRSMSEESVALSKFNDPDNSDTDVLITSFRQGAGAGIFQGPCYTGVILQYPDDLDSMMTAMLCFYQDGLKHAPVWVILHADNTFDAHEQCQLAWLEAYQIAQISPQEYEGFWARQIPEIHPSITGQHRLICAHEIVRSGRKHEVSCYPRERMHWSDMAKPDAMREGEFYAAVGRFLMANPFATSLFTKATMQRIASTWEPGTEISMARIRGNCPALPNGVKIYNFLQEGAGDDML